MKKTNPEKEPFYKKKWFIAIATLIIIGAIFGPKDKDKEETPEPAKVEENQEEAKEEKEEKEVEDIEKEAEQAKEELKEENKESANEELSDEDKKLMVEAIVKGTIGEFFDVKTETEDNIFFINLYPKGDLVTDIMALVVTPNQELLDSWKGVTDMLSDMTKEAQKGIGQDVTLNVMNPANEENILYSNVNGAELYNVVNDK